MSEDQAPTNPSSEQDNSSDQTRPSGEVDQVPSAPAAGPTYEANPFAQQAPAPTKPNTVIPWAIAGVLAVVCALLAGLLIAQNGELSRLRETTTAPTTAANPSASASAALPQPITDEEGIKLVDSLPTRKADDPTAMGEVDAPVVLLIWSDFRCPFCSAWERETFPQLMPYVESGSLRIEHRDLVLFGDESQRTAVAARAAGLQGKYWEFSEAVAAVAPTSGHPEITDEDLIAFAKQVGVADIAKFTKDLDSSELDEAVTADTTQAKAIGLTSTPFFIVNRTPISGAQPLSVFTQVIEANGGTK